MNVYVWERVDQCSHSYHSEGGVVVFAGSLERARELANGISGCSIREDEVPTEVRECGGEAERVFIMRDAGCC